MSDASESSATGLLFPAFMYGDRTTCRRKMKAEAKKWAKCYLAGRDFPELKLIPIAPGSVVFTDDHTAKMVAEGYSFHPHANIVTISSTTKEEGRHLQWRAYMLENLQYGAEFDAELTQPECFSFRSAFVPFVCRYAWGAISTATIKSLLNSIALTVPRIEGVLRHWEALDTLKYIDLYQRPSSLAELMVFYFEGHIAMWVDQPTGNVRTDLQTAMNQMRRASEDEIHKRLIKRLRELVDTETDLKHPAWLKSPGVIEARLEAKRRQRQDTYDDLTSGDNGELGSFLMLLERDHYPGNVH